MLAGNSQAAQLAASYAVEYPETVERMILIASPAFHARMGLGNGIPFLVEQPATASVS